ncbi:MAG: monothiol bacilliredoxin BrxC family protein [Nanoarchaeota archaeon]
MYFPLQDIRTAKQILWTTHTAPVVIFKHDPRNPVSHDAKTHVERFFKEHSEPEVYVLDVLSHQLVSAFIEQVTKIKHETPQTIIISNGKTRVLNQRAIDFIALEGLISSTT